MSNFFRPRIRAQCAKIISILFIITLLSRLVSEKEPISVEGRAIAATGSPDIADCELPWWDGGMEDCSAVMQNYRDQNNKTRSYCGKRADVPGKGQKVITFSFYGNFNEYATGLSDILKKMKEIYPGWVARLYTQPQNYSRELMPLARQFPELYLCDVGNLPGNISDVRHLVHPMLWRDAVLGDELVDVFLSRDLDAVILDREVAAVNEFLESGKTLHSMRDNPAHGMPIMGGMFGIRQTSRNLPLLKSLRNTLFTPAAKVRNDQTLFRFHVYPELKDDMITHDSYNCIKYNDSRPFPTKREDHTFIGNRRYRPNHTRDAIRKPCPVECRPPSHQDWEFC